MNHSMHGEDNSPLASSAFSSLHEEHCSGGHSHDHGDPCTAHSHTHSHQQTKAVINRLSRAIGHLESVKRMVENGEDCSQVLIQIAAVRSALSSTAKVILKDHMEHCIADAFQTGDEAELEELSKAIDKYI